MYELRTLTGAYLTEGSRESAGMVLRSPSMEAIRQAITDLVERDGESVRYEIRDEDGEVIPEDVASQIG